MEATEVVVVPVGMEAAVVPEGMEVMDVDHVAPKNGEY